MLSKLILKRIPKKEKPQALPEVFLEIIVKMRIIDINITSFRQKVND